MKDFNGVIGKLGGKKLLAALVGVLVVILHSWLGLSPEAAKEIAGLLMTYIIGQSVADGWSGGATSSVSAANAEAKHFREMGKK